MAWITIALVAYFLHAINSLVDKYLLGRRIPRPVAYSFYTGIFSLFTVALAPFGLEWPGLFQLSVALFTGFVFLAALSAFFSALKQDEASRIVPFVGGFTPVFSLLLSALFLGEVLTTSEFLAFLFLVAGGVLITARRSRKCGFFEFYKFECVSSALVAILAAFLFACFFVLTKYIFNHQEFLSGFIWIRVGSFFAALSFLLFPSVRHAIFSTSKKVTKGSGALFVVNKTIAGIGFLMLNYSIAIGNVVLVNALEGVKYAFLLLLVFLISKIFPQTIREEMKFWIVVQKVVAITLMLIGFFYLAY